MDLYAGSTVKQTKAAAAVAQSATNLVLRGKLTAKEIDLQRIKCQSVQSTSVTLGEYRLTTSDGSLTVSKNGNLILQLDE